MIQYKEKTLVVESRVDGPWVPVTLLAKVEVRDATPKDSIEIHFREDDLFTTPEPRKVSGSGVTHLDFPKGSVMVKRVRGNTPITVLARCTRLDPGEPPTIK